MICFEKGTGVKCLEKVFLLSGFFCLFSEKKLCLRREVVSIGRLLAVMKMDQKAGVSCNFIRKK